MPGSLRLCMDFVHNNETAVKSTTDRIKKPELMFFKAKIYEGIFLVLHKQLRFDSLHLVYNRHR